MPFRNDPTVAILTGGGQGLGRAIALRMAREGYDLVLAGPEPDPLHAVCAEVEALGARGLAVLADVSKQEQVDRLIEQARKAFGRIDILVNNAGIIGPTAPLDEVELADWNEVLAVNLNGAFLCCRSVIPELKARGSGRILNIASVAGKQAYPMRGPYAVSKWGLIGLTLTLAKELGPHNIQVNAVCPGPVEGPRMRRIFEERAKALGRDVGEIEREYVEASALKRLVQAEDVADLVAFLAGPSGRNITGQAIDVTAGYGL